MRINKTFTLTQDVPINAITGTTAAPPAGSSPVYATRVFVQMIHGGTGLGYVMDGIKVGATPATNVDGDITAELAPATSTAPGGAYSDSDPGGIDLNKFWVAGATTNDKIKLSADLRI
jgi:hypothetical protein